jgi:hypothetical protein
MPVLKPDTQKKQNQRILLVITLQLLMALAFVFRIGTYLPTEGYIFYQSYFADLVMPFSFYFLLSINEVAIPFLRNWAVKAIVIFVGMAATEIFQYFDIYMFGVTFDMLDILAFAIGTMLAVIFDLFVFPKLFTFWIISE